MEDENGLTMVRVGYITLGKNLEPGDYMVVNAFYINNQKHAQGIHGRGDTYHRLQHHLWLLYRRAGNVHSIVDRACIGPPINM